MYTLSYVEWVQIVCACTNISAGLQPTQLPTRKHLSLKEGDVSLHHQKSDYKNHRRNGEMETRVGVHVVRMKFALVGPFLHFSFASLVA